MAKGNLFQGMARGKIGDVVFYRMNGEQMSRVRNRNPKNPRSNEQLYQRAVISTVMKAYSEGKDIYDHAFEGYTVGEGCMRRFNSVNSRILRSQLVTDINTDRALNSQLGRFVWPKSDVSVPINGLQVSEGSAQQNMFNVAPNAITFTPWKANEKAADYLKRMGTTAGDLYTFVFHLATDEIVYKPTWSNSNLAIGRESSFGWIRLTVKDLGTSNPTMISATWNDLFLVETSGPMVQINQTGTLPESSDSEPEPINITFDKDYTYGVAAVIRSRLDIDIRSTSYMEPYLSMDYGISSGFVLEVWKDETQKVGVSELILEGGDLGRQVAAANSQSRTGLPEQISEEAELANEPVDEGGTPKRARAKGSSNPKE